MATDFTQDAVLVFLQSCGGSVKNTELLSHFLPFLREHPDHVRNRELFKKFVNSVATVTKIDGVSTVVLRKRFRGHVSGGGSGRDSAEPGPVGASSSPADSLARPGDTERKAALPAAGIVVESSSGLKQRENPSPEPAGRPTQKGQQVPGLSEGRNRLVSVPAPGGPAVRHPDYIPEPIRGQEIPQEDLVQDSFPEPIRGQVSEPFRGHIVSRQDYTPGPPERQEIHHPHVPTRRLDTPHQGTIPEPVRGHIVGRQDHVPDPVERWDPPNQGIISEPNKGHIVGRQDHVPDPVERWDPPNQGIISEPNKGHIVSRQDHVPDPLRGQKTSHQDHIVEPFRGHIVNRQNHLPGPVRGQQILHQSPFPGPSQRWDAPHQDPRGHMISCVPEPIRGQNISYQDPSRDPLRGWEVSAHNPIPQPLRGQQILYQIPPNLEPLRGQQIPYQVLQNPEYPRGREISYDPVPERIRGQKIYFLDSNPELHRGQKIPYQDLSGQQVPQNPELRRVQQVPQNREPLRGQQIHQNLEPRKGQQIPQTLEPVGGQQIAQSPELRRVQQVHQNLELRKGQQIHQKLEPRKGQQIHQNLEAFGGQQIVQNVEPLKGQQIHQNVEPLKGQQIHQNLEPFKGQQIVKNVEPLKGQQIHQNVEPLKGQQIVKNLEPFKGQQIPQTLEPVGRQQIAQSPELHRVQQVHENLEPRKRQEIHQKIEPLGEQQIVQNLEPVKGQQVHQNVEPFKGQQIHQNLEPLGEQQIVQNLEPFKEQLIPQSPELRRVQPIHQNLEPIRGQKISFQDPIPESLKGQQIPHQDPEPPRGHEPPPQLHQVPARRLRHRKSYKSAVSQDEDEEEEEVEVRRGSAGGQWALNAPLCDVGRAISASSPCIIESPAPPSSSSGKKVPRICIQDSDVEALASRSRSESRSSPEPDQNQGLSSSQSSIFNPPSDVRFSFSDWPPSGSSTTPGRDSSSRADEPTVAPTPQEVLQESRRTKLGRNLKTPLHQSLGNLCDDLLPSGRLSPLYRSSDHLLDDHLHDDQQFGSRGTPWHQSTGDLCDDMQSSNSSIYSTRVQLRSSAARRMSSRLRNRICRSMGTDLDQYLQEGPGGGMEDARLERLHRISSSLSLPHHLSSSSLSSCATPPRCPSPVAQGEGRKEVRRSPHSHNAGQSAVPLEPREHDWMVKAAAGTWPDIYTLFREDNSLLNKQDFISGFTVLHWIAKHGDHRVLNTLWYGVERSGLSFNVNAKSTGGQTPLHIAAIHGHKNIIRLLVKKFGANVKLRDMAGKKPWQYLSDRSPEILQLLGAPPQATLTQEAENTEPGWKPPKQRRRLHHHLSSASSGQRPLTVARLVKVSRSSSIAALLKHKSVQRF
ncbi:uncharacterized protein sowahb [Anableps anableps]